MKEIRVHTKKPYTVKIENGLLGRAGNEILSVMGKRRCVIVSDDNVAPLYEKPLKDTLLSVGICAESFVFPSGEGHKTLKTVEELLSFLVEIQLTRSDFLIALGGGIVGDLCGFAASVYLRGIDFVQIPTTLLAAVDSSVGGKTGVNLGGVKNQVGCFWQPSLVLCDPLCFQSLKPTDYSDGMAEIIKYGVLFDRPLFNLLFEDTLDICDVTTRSVEHKRRCVEADERDIGARQLLNLGHTVGHAIEKRSDGSISHGKAVAMGMLLATKAAVQNGICKENFTKELSALLQKHGLPTACPYAVSELLPLMLNDKKRGGEEISLVLPTACGSATLYRLPTAQLSAFWEGIL